MEEFAKHENEYFFWKARLILVRENIVAFHNKPSPSWDMVKFFVVKFFFIVIIMLQLPTVAVALRVNDFTFSHLGLTDGLNSQRIYSLKQTADGAVWLTTKSYVARYNGASIESFNLTKNTSKHNLIGCNPRFVQSTGVGGCKCLMQGDASMNIIPCKIVLMLWLTRQYFLNTPTNLMMCTKKETLIAWQ